MAARRRSSIDPAQAEAYTIELMRPTQPRLRRASLFAFVALIAAATTPLALAKPSSSAGDDRVVARVGDREITVAEVEGRMRQVPLYQLRVLGKTPDQIRRAFLVHMIDQELLVQGAQSEKLTQRADVAGRHKAVLRSALLASIRQQAGDVSTVTDDEIAAYYKDHQEGYRSKKLLKLWQIVVPTREKAEQLLEQIKTDPDYQKEPVKVWGELAAKHSLDDKTKKRQGNLDFVRPDGTTKHPDVKASPKVYEAANQVADGELVPEPVQVGPTFVIVQRRGTRETPERTLDSETPAIRRKLVQVKYEQKVKALRDQLRKLATEIHPERVDRIEVTLPEAEIVPVSRPGGLPRTRHPAAGSPRPGGRPGRMR